MAGLGCEGLTWPRASAAGCKGSATSLPPPAGESQASISALLVLIFMINIVFPLMVEIFCVLSLPQFTSLPRSGILPGSGEKKKLLSESVL